ncbi:Lsr2 dimerization domain-containing protein [Enemella evansiae]|uniref:Nucleoid-associated protein Lsr2 n=1 Tax=Enemella evansiae TaxID=2016499 RepID=A0A255GNZ9_9ACTN|nr:histone-like nucleoid-structuring protein Lsr2 [Enemella evansiae]OYO14024.1 nucleoid-associated protein Lsr2 [Enemella evansiae]OYO17537.1 nucleoid-associated protein Lsr2 [Enemella evansiae]TDO89563.1 Lsr2 protein [Enemella evansiae]
MATKHLTVSDLSGEPGAATVQLALGSERRDVDLTEAERAELDDLLRPYLSAGRRAEQAAPKPNRDIPVTTAEERAAIRKWARENGFELADRGMIPKEIYRAYVDARAEAAS